MYINNNTDNHVNHLRECVLTTIILAPGASEVGLGAAALAPLCVDTRLPGLPGLNSARSLFMRRHRKRSKY